MELAALLLGLASAGIGLALRRHLSVRIGRVSLVIGGSALILGVGAFSLAFANWISAWTAALLALFLFTVGIVLFPFALSLLLFRPSGKPAS